MESDKDLANPEKSDPMLLQSEAKTIEGESEKLEKDAEESDPMLRSEAELGLGDNGAATGHDGAEAVPNGVRSKSELPAYTGRASPVPPIEVTTAMCTKPAASGCFSFLNARKVLLGLTIGLSVAVSWVAATQFVTSTYSPTFDAPYFTIWFSTGWMMVCYPIYIVGSLVLFKECREGGVKALFKEDGQIYGSAGFTVLHCLRLTGPFCALWMISNYMYFAALKYRAPTDVTAIFVTNTAFIYAFSWIWLEEVLILLPARLFSVALSIAGTVLVMAGGGFVGGKMIGVFLALGSAIGAALYKVLFKRFLGDATYGQVSLFLTMLGLLNVVLLWPIVLILYYTDVETIEWDNLPWAYLCGASALSIVFNFLVNFGIAITYPLLISLANIVGIPINAVIDSAFRSIHLGPLKIVGSLLIIGGFIVMLLPESWQVKAACWKEGEEPCCRHHPPGQQQLPDEEPEEEREEENVESV